MAWRRWLWVLPTALCLTGACAGPALAPLALTEVMSETAYDSEQMFKGPDFWELTNYGTNDIDLDGYSFNDTRRTNSPPITAPFIDLVIHAGESILFFRTRPYCTVCNAEQFVEWWEHPTLPLEMQIRTYDQPGLDGQAGDELWLYDPQLNVVDGVKFGEARIGRSFIPEPASGVFGTLSVAGMDGAFRSAMGGDIGSPGIAPTAIPLQIVHQPIDRIGEAGRSAEFAVVASGLPRPKYQWFKNGHKIEGATAATLVLSNLKADDAAEYHVWMANGLQEFTSATARLTVQTNDRAPVLLSPLCDQTVFIGQTAVFSVQASAFPSPAWQWLSNDVEIAGATNDTLTLPDVSPAMSGTRYAVRVWNRRGETNASAVLTVTPRPCLRVSEVMPWPANDQTSGHYDWFELTNCDTNAVNLQGYRFFDTESFGGAFTITNDILLQPGESIVFVEKLSAAEFKEWWGPAQLPPDLHVVTFHGFSLWDYGEQLYLWNAASTDPGDAIATASWARATPGVSLECESYCEPGVNCDGMCLLDSEPGFRGAFRVPEWGDIGSPGSTANRPPRVTRIQCDGTSVVLRCRVTPNLVYRLCCAVSVPASEWFELDRKAAYDGELTFTDSPGAGEPSRFYRIEELFVDD